METLGDFLKQRREAAGLSLEDLAQRTRIRIENLQSLEREDLDALPNEPYVRGFVKLVCRELGLEPQDGVLRYETLRQRSGPMDEMTWDEETTEVAPGLLERALGDPERVVRRATAVGRWAGIGVAAVAAVAVLVVAFRWIDPFAPRTTKPVGVLPAEAAPVPAPELAAIPERKEPEPEMAAEVPEVATPAPSKPAPSKPKSEPVEAKTAAAEPEAPPTRTVIAAPERAVPKAAAPATGERAILRLEALRPVQVSVLLDGSGFPRTRSLAAGESATWKADEFFVLDASDGGAVRVFSAGKLLGLAGADGAPVEGLTIRPR